MIDKSQLKKMLDGINTNIGKRWEKGVPHHPKALRLASMIAAIDHHFGGDSLGLKFGGDGDSGEALLYALDIYFEWRAKTKKTRLRALADEIEASLANGSNGGMLLEDVLSKIEEIIEEGETR